jgi:hypothetical protein
MSEKKGFRSVGSPTNLLKEEKMSGLNRITLAGAAVVALVVFGPVGTASAFHDGGVAHCDGCHTMHNSAENRTLTGDDPSLGDHLLIGSDTSSTCLDCHDGAERYHVKSDDGSNVGQGGDFFWMTVDYNVEVRPGTFRFFSKDDHGHNVIAENFGMFEDANPDNSQAPGGTYPASALGCTSCHDPHGRAGGGTAAGLEPISVSGSYGATPDPGTRAGNFRLLGDNSYIPPGGGLAMAPAPIALTTSGGFYSYGAKTDYGTGMSEWCASCHTDYLDAYPAKHPAASDALVGDALGSPGDNYNKYLKTGDFNDTISQADAYDSLVPIERGTDDQSLLDVDSTFGADALSAVMCLTCHRAHASANPNAGRWDFEVELLSHSNALQAGGAPLGSAVYYKDGLVINVAGVYGDFQRSLCNKCHVQD